MRYLRHPFHGTVVGYLALFVALSGTAWAVAANSVGTQQLKDNAVTGAKVLNGSLVGADVHPNSLGGAQINESSLAPRILQRRVTGTCSSGRAIATIHQNGRVGCSAAGPMVPGPPGAATWCSAIATLSALAILPDAWVPSPLPDPWRTTRSWCSPVASRSTSSPGAPT